MLARVNQWYSNWQYVSVMTPFLLLGRKARQAGGSTSFSLPLLLYAVPSFIFTHTLPDNIVVLYDYDHKQSARLFVGPVQ